MTNPLPESARRVLEELLAGEVDARDPRVTSVFAEHPAARAEWERLSDLGSRLDDAADEDLRDLRAALATREPALDQVERLLEARQPARRPWVWWSAAAALLLGALWLGMAMLDDDPPSDPDRLELGGEDEITAPAEVLEPGAAIEWNLTRPEGGFFVLEFHAPGSDVPVLEIHDITEPTWTPTAAEYDRIPRSFVVHVFACDAMGNFVTDARRELRLP